MSNIHLIASYLFNGCPFLLREGDTIAERLWKHVVVPYRYPYLVAATRSNLLQTPAITTDTFVRFGAFCSLKLSVLDGAFHVCWHA